MLIKNRFLCMKLKMTNYIILVDIYLKHLPTPRYFTPAFISRLS